MKKHTVDILDDADAAERRMNWVLFQQEQAAILYREGELEWNPGWPLYTNPDYINWPEWPWVDLETVEEEGRDRQCDRHMLELIADVAHSHFVPEHPWSIFSFMSSRHPFGNWKPRCEECEVSWLGPEACWSCGKEVATPEPLVSKKLFQDLMADLDRQFEQHVLHGMSLNMNRAVERYMSPYIETDAAAMELIYHQASQLDPWPGDFETTGWDNMRIVFESRPIRLELPNNFDGDTELFLDEALWRRANAPARGVPINWSPNAPRRHGRSLLSRYWLDEWVSDRIATELPSDISLERPIPMPEIFRWRLSSYAEVRRYERLMEGETQLGWPRDNNER